MPQPRLHHTSRASALFRRTLSPDAIEKVGRRTRFIQRKRRVTATGIFWALILAVGAHPMRYISDVLRMLNKREGWALAYKPFWNRLAKPAFPALMKAMFEQMCRDLMTRVLQRQEPGVAKLFSQILLDDGSSFAVADGLRRFFPGRFTKVTPAAVELHAHMDVMQDNLLSVALAPDKEAERQFLPSAEALRAGSLSLRDRGYIDRDYFEALERRSEKAYLICRAIKTLNPTIVEMRGAARSFAKKWRGKPLQKLAKSKLRRDHDLVVSWKRTGGAELKLRLVIRYVPEKRSWTWLLTNVTLAQASADSIAELYRLRWQIELVFKDWKSNANLHALESEHPAIVEGFIWASLCAAFIKRALAHWAQVLAEGHALSSRIAAMAGPQILPDLAQWAVTGFPPDLLTKILTFLATNARRTNPKRDRTGTRALVGLEFAVDGPEHEAA